MIDNSSSQEAEITREEAIEKLIELSAQNNDDFETYRKYFNCVARGDTECSYLAWLKDDHFSPHVKLAIYEQLLSSWDFYIAQQRLDQAQADRDMCDYLCHHLSERTYFPYRDMLSSFLELRGRLTNFDYPIKTCQMIMNIALNPEKYSKHKVCCALNVLRYCHSRFKVTWDDDDRFFKDMAEKWTKIALETDDLDICIEALYYALMKVNLESSEYQALIEKLWDKHPHDRVTLVLYGQYLKPCVMFLAFDRLKLLREHDVSLGEEASGLFSYEVSSPEFMHSIDFDQNNELIQFCISNKECWKDLVEGMNEHYYTEGYFNIIDILLNFYLKQESCSKFKTSSLNIVIKLVRNRKHLKGKDGFNAYLNMVNTYIEKITDNCISEPKDDIKQLRCVQALALLLRFSSVHERIRKKLRDSVLFILIEDAKFSEGNAAVRQILLYIYLAMFNNSIRYRDIQELLEKVNDVPELFESYLFILYHVLDRLKCSEDELNSLFSVVVQQKNDSSTRTRVLTQVLYNKFLDSCHKKHFKNVKLLQNEPDAVHIESELGSDSVFLKELNPFSEICLEIVFCLIPKLNEIGADEWKNNIEICNSYLITEPKNKPIVDNFRASVGEFLSSKY